MDQVPWISLLKIVVLLYVLVILSALTDTVSSLVEPISPFPSHLKAAVVEGGENLRLSAPATVALSFQLSGRSPHRTG